MQYTILNDGMKISRLGLGCWTIGGPSFTNGFASGWSKIDEKEVEEAINFAVNNGLNHFDNADCYGHGFAEQLLAKSLGKYKNNVVISSKVGWLKNEFEHAYCRENIIKQCEKSLKNLKRDFIDIYYFHHGDFGKNDRYLDEAMDTMLLLKKLGKIKIIGLSCYTTKDFVRLIPKIKPQILQGLANILEDKFIRPQTLVRQLLDKYKIPFVAFSPLAQGLLTGKYSAKNPPVFEDGDHRKNSEKFTKKYLEKFERKILELKLGDKNLTKYAIQYLLAYQCVGSVITGFRNLEQVKINIGIENESRNQ